MDATELTPASVVARTYGPFATVWEVGDSWWIGLTSDAVVVWPVPAAGFSVPSAKTVLGQVIKARRRYPEYPCKVVLPTHVGNRDDHLLVAVEDFNSVFARATPDVEVLELHRDVFSRLCPPSPLAAVAPGTLPVRLQALAQQVFGRAAQPEYAWYQGSVFAEYRGIPVLGMAGESLVVGIDPRDQAMAKEALMTPESLEAFAREVLLTLLGSRERRQGRFDFSRVALGRLLRSRFRVEHPEVMPIEFGTVGQARSRAYAKTGQDFCGFGSAVDLWLVVETAALWRLAGQARQVTYVLDGEPMKAFVELARLVGVPYSIEVKELTGG
ncbi:hypothetical protein [Ferrimicrobium sp.]|uniref:hypothetical protein n=1 Tax=Ferrimicrobium sp. TaxID=2926050 RepID=UPI00260368A7|nr:hypothetical protein [Ferrimicrobium sp.]